VPRHAAHAGLHDRDVEAAQIEGRHRGERLRGQLLLHGGEIEPGALAADAAVLEVEDVQEASAISSAR
jgi:hypothetical protein